MHLFKFLLRISWRMVVLAILIGVVSGASSTGLLALIDARLNSGRLSATTLLWSFAALCVLVPVTRFTSETLLIRLGQGAIYNLRLEMSRRILAAPLRHLEELGTHRLLATLTDDIPAITNALTFIPIFCINIVIVLGCLLYLGWISPSVLVAVLAFMVLGIASYQLPIMKALHFHRKAREESDNLYNHFRALTSGAKELKLHHHRREAFLTTLLEPTARSLRHNNLVGISIFIAAVSWGQILFFIVIGLLLFALAGSLNLSGQVLTSSTLAMLYMMTPLEVILGALPNMGRASVALKKVEALGLSLKAKSVEDSLAAPPASLTHWGELDLAGVMHTYHREKENSRFTLGPIDLSFKPGETVFLTGGNGSGKTTLVKLIVGLYAPEGGEIRLNGQPVTDQAREFYRQHFSVVFSDFFLFESLLGIEARELDAKAREYLTQLHLDHKVQVKDGRLSTTDLSQGQRKRLALLAAYLEDRPIYVFDEWAADQDPLFKEIFYLQLLPELKARGKTVLVISHDDHYYHVADRLIKMDYGLIEQDTYLTRPEAAQRRPSLELSRQSAGNR
jgi:putative pyoverdin transport system ATP-binding/permease protein